MRKNLLLTCLMTLVAAFGMAQTTQWPITLTTADGLPGTKVVLNYSYTSKVYNLEEATSLLRFTVISTNTVDSLTTGSNDGLSVGWGTGFPFFTMSELRIFNGEGKKIDYVANGNALATNDGGGLAALSDNNEGTYLHTTYSKGTLPHEYHYIELELSEPVSSFSFNWNTRSSYHKNLITYMGITPGTQYLPYPEQQFQLGEQVTTVEELAEEGALFVIRANAEDYQYHPEANPDIDRLTHGKVFYHSPYGADDTANAASLVYLIPDATVENGYKVCWLNNGHYMIKQELNSGWFHWTNDELKAGTVTFAPCDTVEGSFSMSMNDGGYLISHDVIGKMALVENTDEAKAKRARPNCYNFNIYKASINGSAITAQLQAAVDEAQTRLDAVGLHEEDQGEYEALTTAVAKAKELIANSEVSAAEIITATRELNVLTAAYAAVTIWAYVDSIDAINAAVEAEEIVITSAPDWVEGAYNEIAYNALLAMSDEVQVVIDNYQSLAEIDEAIAKIFASIDNFWASKVANVKELPFRVGTTEDGLPGTQESYGGFHWESPIYNLKGEYETIRMTVFNTNNGAKYNQTVFPTFAEMEFYNATGEKIALTEENFTTNSVHPGDGNGIPGLCDGDKNTHYHGAYGDNQDPNGFTGTEYVYIEVTFPEPISSFKYVQYGRKNAANTPIDFVFGEGGTSYTPEDVDLPDFYNTTLGEQVTDASQITDDGFYAFVGLINCAPEGDGTGYEKFYTSNVVYGKKVGAPAVYSIRKTDEEGAFYIQSLANGNYWAQTIDEDGWGGSAITTDKSEAGKFFIKPMPRAEYGKDTSYENTFVVYMYNDTVKRVANDTGVWGTEPVAHPYIVMQDYAGGSGYFSCPTLEYNDWDGEGEWKIFKVTMDTPHLYWLKSVYAAAAALKIEVGTDPGYYSAETAGAYGEAMAKAQAALESGNDAMAKEALVGIEENFVMAQNATTNPVVEGVYVIESALPFMANKGVNKVMCTYYNSFDAGSPMCTSTMSLYWGDAPADYKNCHDRYKFELVSAKESEQVLIWVEDSLISPEEAEQTFFVKSVETGQFVYYCDTYGQMIGLAENAADAAPYLVRNKGAYSFEFWHPNNGDYSAYRSFHANSHSNGTGDGGTIIYWTGSETASHWRLRTISTKTSISDIVVEGDEVVSVAYYTAAGAQVPAPVKGINIVKIVYANGVVKSEKVYIK